MSYRIQACNSFPFFSAVLCPGNKLITFILFVFTPAFAQEGKSTVAILDFEGQGVDAAEVQTLTERMRTEIGNTKAVRLIERKAVEKIMAEQGMDSQGVPVASGVYFAVLRDSRQVRITKMMILK